MGSDNWDKKGFGGEWVYSPALKDYNPAQSDREDSTRGLYRLIEEQNKLIEKQGKRQIDLLEKILNKLVGGGW